MHWSGCISALCFCQIGEIQHVRHAVALSKMCGSQPVRRVGGSPATDLRFHTCAFSFVEASLDVLLWSLQNNRQVFHAIQPLMAVHTMSGYCFWCCGLMLLVVPYYRRWWCCGGGVGHLCLACTRQLLVPTKPSCEAFQPTSCLNKCPEPVR